MQPLRIKYKEAIKISAARNKNKNKNKEGEDFVILQDFYVSSL